MTARTPWAQRTAPPRRATTGLGSRRPEALSGCSTPAHDLLNLARDRGGVSIAHLRESQWPGRTLALPQWSGDVGVRSRVLRSARGNLDLVVVALVAGAIYVAHGYSGLLSRDLGVFTYGGEHVARGIPPYLGIFNSVGPLADLVPGLAIWLGHQAGLDPILSERLLFTLLSVACCVILSVLARDIFGLRAAGFLAPAVFLSFQRFTQLASDGPREKTTMLVFLLATLVLVGRRRWVAAGVCTALATLAWQPSFAVAVVAAVVGLLCLPRGRWLAAGRFVVGGMIPSAATVAYFVATGALHAAISGFVTVNVLYTHQPSLLSAPASTLRFLWIGYRFSLVVFAVGLVALLTLTAAHVGGLVMRSRLLPDHARAVAVATVGLAALTGSAWTLIAINGAPDLFELLPFAALGVCGAILALARWLSPRLVTALVAAVASAAVALAAVESVGTVGFRLDQQRADIAAVLAAAPRGASLFSINAPEVLAITGRTNPSHFQLFDGAINAYIDHTWPGGLKGFSGYVTHLRPTLVAISSGYASAWPQRMLTHHYWRVGRGASWSWFLSRSAGPRALAAVRAANLSVMRPGAPAST
jgi:hypothetical protein